MAIFLTLLVVGIYLFVKYNNDKDTLKNTINQKGGMKNLYSQFIHFVNDEFKEVSIDEISGTEIELKVKSYDDKRFIFGIKHGFNNTTSYRADVNSSTHINAEIAFTGSIIQQVEVYNQIIKALKTKHKFNLRFETDLPNEITKSDSITSLSMKSKYKDLAYNLCGALPTFYGETNSEIKFSRSTNIIKYNFLIVEILNKIKLTWKLESNDNIMKQKEWEFSKNESHDNISMIVTNYYQEVMNEMFDLDED